MCPLLQPLENCVGCLQKMPQVKLQKRCAEPEVSCFIFACQSILLSPSLLSFLLSLSSLLYILSFAPSSLLPFSFLPSLLFLLLPSLFYFPLPPFFHLLSFTTLLFLPSLLLPHSVLFPPSFFHHPALPSSFLSLFTPSSAPFPLSFVLFPPSSFHHPALPSSFLSLLTPSSLLTPPLPLLFLPPSQEGSCRQCFCRPMWCFSCMSKWFAARQNQQQPETWMGSTAPCPMCRAQFCVLDVLALQGVQLE